MRVGNERQLQGQEAESGAPYLTPSGGCTMPWVRTSIVWSQMESPKVRDMASITCKHKRLCMCWSMSRQPLW